MQHASRAMDSAAEPRAGETERGSPGGLLRFGPAALIAAVLVLSWVVPLWSTGLWEPFEIETGDLARRAAIHLFGASELASDGNDSIPSVEDVGRGELGVLSIALSLSLFGSSPWALRLPMLLWGLLGLGATYWLCARLFDRRLALRAVVVLATCPIYFLHARTALGDIVTMASVAIAFAGLLLAVFDASPKQRALAFALGVLGLLAGAFSRGVLIGVAVPSLSVGLCWLLASGFVNERAGAGERASLGRLSVVCGALCLVVGVLASGWGAWAAWAGTPDDYSKALGSSVVNPKQFATHDFVVHNLGHGMYPWSALAPLALGFALRPVGGAGRALGEFALRTGLLLLVVIGVGAFTLLAPRVGLVPFAPVFGLAIIVALALDEVDRRPAAALGLAMVSAALLVLLYTDYQNFPEKGFSAFGVASAAFPETFKTDAKRYVQVSMGLGALACVVIALERAMDTTRWGSTLARVQQRWARVRVLSVLVGGAARVVRRLEALQSRPWRGSLLGLAVVLSGLVLSLGYYPALGSQLSPVGAYDSYTKLAKKGEPLAILGQKGGAVFLAGESAEVFTSTHKAISWLTEKPEQRRWLVTKQKDLASLNSSFRRASSSGRVNLPVLDDASSQALLVSNLLLDGEDDQNPFAAWLPEKRPSLARRLDVELDGRLQVLGWELRSANGRVVSELRLGRPFQFVIGYEVTARVTGTWQTFIHIDGEGKRFNGDHDTLEGEYPYRLWNKGDYVLDIHEFELDSSYPPGDYQIYFGLFSGDKRMAVTRGTHGEDRIHAGTLRVRR